MYGVVTWISGIWNPLFSNPYWYIPISIFVLIVYIFRFATVSSYLILSYFYVLNIIITFIYIVFSKGKSYTLGYDTAFSKFQDFRNDAEKRCFTLQSWNAILSYVILSCVILSCLYFIHLTLSCLIVKMLFLMLLLHCVIAVYLPLYSSINTCMQEK